MVKYKLNVVFFRYMYFPKTGLLNTCILFGKIISIYEYLWKFCDLIGHVIGITEEWLDFFVRLFLTPFVCLKQVSFLGHFVIFIYL